MRTAYFGCSTDDRGATLVEYLILVGAIALVALVGFRQFGGSVSAKTEREASCVASLDGSCASGSTAGTSGSSAMVSGTAASARTETAGTQASLARQTSDTARPPKGGFAEGAEDVGLGILSGAWGAVQSLGTLGWSSFAPVMVSDVIAGRRNAAIDAVTGVTTFVGSASPPGRLIAAMGGPDPATDMVQAAMRQISEDWKQNPRKFVGRVIGGLAVGYGIGKAGQLLRFAGALRVATAAQGIEEAAATAAARAERAAMVADEAADAERAIAGATRTAEQLANAKTLASKFRFGELTPTARVRQALKSWPKGFEAKAKGFRREDWMGAPIPEVVPERTAQAFREAARFIENPKRIVPRLQELESEVVARSGTTTDPLEAALSEMEARQGFAPVREINNELAPNEFAQVLRDGTPIRDVTFEGWEHGVQTHRIQWWALSREMESNPEAFAKISPPELYRSYGEYWEPLGTMTQKPIFWDRTFDILSNGDPGGPWSPEWFRDAQTALPGLRWR